MKYVNRFLLFFLLTTVSVTAGERPSCWEDESAGFIGCGQVEYVISVANESNGMTQVQYRSNWIVWKDDDETFVMYFDKKLSEVADNASALGYVARAWMIPRDSADQAPLFNSGRAWRPVGTVIVLPKKFWCEYADGGNLREYFQKVLADVVPAGSRRFVGDVVNSPEMSPAYVARK